MVTGKNGNQASKNALCWDDSCTFLSPHNATSMFCLTSLSSKVCHSYFPKFHSVKKKEKWLKKRKDVKVFFIILILSFKLLFLVFVISHIFTQRTILYLYLIFSQESPWSSSSLLSIMLPSWSRSFEAVSRLQLRLSDQKGTYTTLLVGHWNFLDVILLSVLNSDMCM